MFLPCLYVNSTASAPYAEALVRGIKPLETRTTHTLDRFTNSVVGILRKSYNGNKVLVGFVRIGGRKDYRSRKEFRDDLPLHLVPEGSKYDWKGRKCAYQVDSVCYLQNPIPFEDLTVIRRDRQAAYIDFKYKYLPDAVVSAILN